MNKKFLLTLAKFIDHKINTCKLKFRSKNKRILVDEISKKVASEILTLNDTKLFKTYKSLANEFALKQKEQKIFKFLLAQKLFYLLSKFSSDCSEISKTISKSKTTCKIQKQKKQINHLAQIYSISKYNPNATKLLIDNISINNDINDLFRELFEVERKIKIIILYLSNMFT